MDAIFLHTGCCTVMYCGGERDVGGQCGGDGWQHPSSSPLLQLTCCLTRPPSLLSVILDRATLESVPPATSNSMTLPRACHFKGVPLLEGMPLLSWGHSSFRRCHFQGHTTSEGVPLLRARHFSGRHFKSMPLPRARLF